MFNELKLFMSITMKYYLEADKLFKIYNPCQPTSDGGCLGCIERRDIFQAEPFTRCCKGCKHHTKENGCKTKSVACKLWVCDGILHKSHNNKKYREFMKHLDRIRQRYCNELNNLINSFPDLIWPGPREALRDNIKRYLRRDRAQRFVDNQRIQRQGGVV